MFLTVLGNGAGGPYQGRAYTAQVLQVDNQYFLIDCGEGTQMKLYQYRAKTDQFRHIFISHLHGDHVFGLIGLLTSWCIKKRTEPLHLYAPKGLRELVEATARVCGIVFPYPLEFMEVDTTVHRKIFENSKVEVWTIPLNHRTPTSGWLFREKQRPLNILKSKIEAYDIPFALIPGIKAGDDLVLPDGRIIPNAELTTMPAAPRSYAFCSDTAPSDTVVEVVRQVDLLYHEATFTAEHTEEAAISYHSTAAQAAEIARRAGVRQLLIGHISGRYQDTAQHLAEARAIFEPTDVAEEGKIIEIHTP